MPFSMMLVEITTRALRAGRDTDAGGLWNSFRSACIEAF